MIAYIRLLSLCLVVLVVCSCATPTTPTGGPRDQEGPTIIATDPETGTTHFDGRTISLEFSEFVDRSSLANAIAIEPDLDIDYSLNWGRKSVDIEFEGTLPELTTVIVSIGTELTDVNNNKMSSPVKVAVSTGPDIDEGELSGRILDAQTGRGEEGNRILLYRTPVDLSQKANYSAQTDTSGSFQFSYLRQGDYKAFWVDDRNRNKIWDRERERAQPFSEEYVLLEEGEQDTLGNIYLANSDTTRPRLQGVGLFSSQRMRMRFSEDIDITDNTAITITDSLGEAYSEAFPLYISPSEGYVLFAHSEEPLSEEESYGINLQNITDGSGNPLAENNLTFTGSAQEDTTRQRIVRRVNQTGIYPDEAVEVIYARNISSGAITDSVKVVEGNEMTEDWASVSAERNRLRIAPGDRWKSGVDYEVRIWNPIVEDYRNMRPAIWGDDDLGILSIQMEDSTETDTLRLSLISDQRGPMADTTFSRGIEIEHLPPLNYRVIVYKDLNGNGRWDPGSVEPFEAPEPYMIRRNVPVESAFTSDLFISFPN